MDLETQNDGDLYGVKADEMPALKCLPLVNFIAVCLLALGMIVLWSTAVENGTFSFTPVPSKGLILNTNDNTYSFNIVGSVIGNLVRIPATGSLPIQFDRLSRYTVCCHTADRSYFVCHSVTRNIGVECVIQQNRNTKETFASIVVQHNDMVGAMCVLNWKYKKV